MRKALPVIVLAMIGLGLSVALEVVHRRLSADVEYASFCNVSAGVNCDVVLSSRYASLFGVSVSAWAILFYVALLALVVGTIRVRRAKLRATLGTLSFALVAWGLLFSLYMAAVAFAVLHTVCLLCAGLYLTNTGLFLVAWRLRRGLQVIGARQAAERARQDRMVMVGSLFAAAMLIAVGSWEALGRSGTALDAAGIERVRPDFFRWYLAQPVMDVSTDGRHARGAADAPVVVVEFSDFECGHCAIFHDSLRGVLRRGQNVRVLFRHFPLDSSCNPKIPSRLHPQACLAAVASECAAEQGKFWQYQDLLFANQRHLEREFLISYAGRLGLDKARFTACLGSDEARSRVERDTQAGASLDIESTPTIFINGRKIKGALEPERLRDALTLAQSGH